MISKIKKILKKFKTNTTVYFKKKVTPNHSKLDGVIVPTSLPGITPEIRNSIYAGKYESAERTFIKKVLQKGDRFVEIGCGLGVITCLAAKIAGEENVTSYEALQTTAEMARNTFQLNQVSPSLIEAAIVGDDSEFVEINTWDAFWSASLHNRDIIGPAQNNVRVKARKLSAELKDKKNQSITGRCRRCGNRLR